MGYGVEKRGGSEPLSTEEPPLGLTAVQSLPLREASTMPIEAKNNRRSGIVLEEVAQPAAGIFLGVQPDTHVILSLFCEESD